MANALYPFWKQELLKHTANSDLDDSEGNTGVFCALVDTGVYTYAGAHDYYNDLSGIVGTDQEITTKTQVNGVFDGDDLTFSSVSGNTVEALVIYRKNAGANTTWFLVGYIDTGVTGLPVTPNGGDITVTWNASGIFTLSDRRFKTDIRQVGELGGTLGVYEFSYAGREERVTGLMAQEVEKVAPAAVIDFGKVKAVNYRKAVDQVMLQAA